MEILSEFVAYVRRVGVDEAMDNLAALDLNCYNDIGDVIETKRKLTKTKAAIFRDYGDNN